MEYKIVLILLLLGAAIFSGCVDNPEKSIAGTYVFDNEPDSYFTLYSNGTIV
jgi:hypothetical protein